MSSDDEEKENDEERRRMVAEIEDLKFQLITLQEQLTTSQHKILTLEVYDN